MNPLSFAVTAYQEMAPVRRQGGRLLEAIAAAQQHDSVAEIVVVDDGSTDFDELEAFLNGQPKVHLYHQPENQGVFGNKLEAVARATCDWVITCDSDNRMAAEFIDQIVAIDKRPECWYCPSFARPDFDYRHLAGDYDLGGIGAIIDRPRFDCMMNTGNQTVHRESFMEVFGPYRGKRADLMNPNYLGLLPAQRPMKYWRLVFDALDSFIYNMTWLSAGGKLHIVSGLEYDHYRTSGLESNYARSPQEKDDLGVILFKELKCLAVQTQ